MKPEKMMEITRNVSPPPDFIDYEIITGTRTIVRLSHIGEPLKYIADVSESDFITPSGSECSDLSSGEDFKGVENAASSKNSVEKESSASSKSQASKTNFVKAKTKTLFEFDATNDEKKKKKKKKKKRWDSPSRRWPGVQCSDSEFSSEEQNIKPKVRPIQSLGKPVKVEEPEEDVKPQLGGAFGEFHCAVCNITVNSELTLQTHLMGKRHRKELKAREIPDLAMQGVAVMRGVSVFPPDPKLSKPNRRKIEHGISEIQAVADDYKKGPVPALSLVTEIRTREKRDYTYYCKVCDSHCTPINIMAHLVGYKHSLNSLELIDPESHQQYAYCNKKLVEHKVKRKLEAYEREHGRGLIMVEEEEEAPISSHLDEPGPSTRDDVIKKESADSALQGAGVDYSGVSSREDLNTSYNDFYCIVCDSHMNNVSMWESHVRGKRHLKNKRKPQDNISSKTKSFEDPNATAHLMRQLNEVQGPIVGLDYIKETQGELGEQYNCYLCGSCTSSYDIIEHLLTSKHRIKFLEAANKKGQVNGIAAIISMYEVGGYYKDSLVEDECFKHVQQYGSGRIKVYKTKELLEQERSKY